METVLIVVHLMVVLALVGVVLLQRSEGGALGIGGGGGFMSARGAANALTRTTAILAAAFFATSISLGVLAKVATRPADVLDQVPAQVQQGTKTDGKAGGAGGVFDQLAPKTESGDQNGGAAKEPAKPEAPQVPIGQ